MIGRTKAHFYFIGSRLNLHSKTKPLTYDTQEFTNTSICFGCYLLSAHGRVNSVIFYILFLTFSFNLEEFSAVNAPWQFVLHNFLQRPHLIEMSEV
jgi:hypothetical protein